VLLEPFDYSPLDADVIRRVRTAAERIRQMVKRTLEVLIAVGEELLAVKQALPHGDFGPWLRVEFGWTERTARNFMTVAERFGPKTEIISDLRIDPTAAYLLAAPSAPEEASEAAVKRAEDGERITVAVAKQILDSLRKRQGRPRRTASYELPSPKLLGELLGTLESLRRRWDPRHVSVLARQLREFADSLEEEPG
jgi:hypothetical protein